MIFSDNCWRQFDRSTAEVTTVPGTGDVMSICIGNRIFFSEKYVEPDEVTAYRFKPSVAVTTFAQAAE